MLRSIFTKALRDYRWAILGWGIGLGLLVFSQYATYGQLYGSASGAATLTQLAGQFRFFGDPIQLGTPGGYAQFRAMGLVPVFLAIWTLLAGARMTRGEEERGALDIVLATPQSRTRLVVEKLVALGAATGLICLLIALWTVLGMASAKVAVDVAAALLTGLNVGLAAFFFGALALLLAQFVSRSAAAGWAGGLLALLYFLDGAGRAAGVAGGIRRLSPLYYYQLSKPLVPSYGMNWGAVAVLLLLSILAAGLAAWLFVRRDMGRSALADAAWGRGATAHAHAHARTSAQVLAAAARETAVRGIGVQALRRQRTAMLWWIGSLAVYSGYLVVVAKSTEKQLADALGGSSLVKQLFGGANLATNNGFLAVIIFGYVPLVVAIFAGMMAYRWPTDLDNGRLELILGEPITRWRVVLERYAAVLIGAVAAPLAVWLGVVLFAQATGFTIDGGRVAAASIGMLPLELLTASLVFALAGLLPPGLVMGIMAAFLGVSFLADILKRLLNLPDWVVNFSMFQQYGTPMLDGLNWTAFAVMLLFAAALLALGVWQFSVRDLDRGAVAS